MEKTDNSDKISVAQRRLKVGEMVASGKKQAEIMQYFGISRRTFYRDMEYVRALNKGSYASDYACIRMVEVPEYLLRRTMILYHKAEDENTKLRALITANKILNTLVRVYERLGMIPSLKHETRIQSNDANLLKIKQDALRIVKEKNKFE